MVESQAGPPAAMNALGCSMACTSSCGHLCSPCVGRSLGEGALSLFASQSKQMVDRKRVRGGGRQVPIAAAAPAAATTQLRFRQQHRMRQQQSPVPPLARPQLQQSPSRGYGDWPQAAAARDATPRGPESASADEDRVGMQPLHA